MTQHNWGNGDPRTSTSAWRRLRDQVITRDGEHCAACQATNTPLELDHILNVRRGGTDHIDNTQLLCVPCHKKKTAREAAAGRAAQRQRLRLPSEPHPGLVGGHPNPQNRSARTV